MAGWPTPTDLEVRLGRAFSSDETSQAEAAIADVVASVRAYTGQQVTSATTTARLKVRKGRARLPQRPVTAVTAVVSTEGAALPFTWLTGDVVEPTRMLIANGPDYSLWEYVRYVDVTYTHGYTDVPADLFALVCQVAARVLGSPPDQSGTQSESLVNYSHTTGAAAAQGAVGLLAGERAILDRYKLPASPIAVL